MAYDRVHQRQRGAVSLFIVIFSMLLITVLTLSFIRLMVRDQQQASDSDLSQSAYDSATSGVEDAKRAILKYQNVCGDPSQAVYCAKLTATLSSNSCTMLQGMGITGVTDTGSDGNNEVSIQRTTDGTQSLNQAYTCVKIALDTPDYLGTLQAGDSTVIPLNAGSANSQVNSVQLSWFSYDNFSSSNPSATQAVDLRLLTNPAALPLYAAGGSSVTTTWPKNRPSLVRAQLMQYAASAGFTLSSFDNTSADLKSNSNTLFLYPSSVGATTTTFANDIRRSASNTPEIVSCSKSLMSSLYACSTTITLPDPIGGNAANRVAYLRLSALYNKMDYSVQLKNAAGVIIPFHAVQPSVDSTGRANDLFRRVQSRIDLTGTFPYPDASVDVTGNLCKNFVVTNSLGDYKNSCTP